MSAGLRLQQEGGQREQGVGSGGHWERMAPSIWAKVWQGLGQASTEGSLGINKDVDLD